jgi:hypothetical protein
VGSIAHVKSNVNHNIAPLYQNRLPGRLGSSPRLSALTEARIDLEAQSQFLVVGVERLSTPSKIAQVGYRPVPATSTRAVVQRIPGRMDESARRRQTGLWQHIKHGQQTNH